MIPAILHTIWIGDDMPSKIRTCIQSVGERHPLWSHIIWDEAMLVAALSTKIDALKEELTSWASVTNWLRLQLLERFGGIYLDADVECYRSLDVLREIRGAFAAEQDKGRICNAVMGAPAHNDWIRWQIDHWHEFDQKDAASGVYLATAAPRNQVTLVPQHLVFPFLYDAPPEDRRPHPESLLAHHWLKSW